MAESRIVSTPLGKVQGKRIQESAELKKPVDAFLGIPFAKPPVGPLRFKKPEAPEPWSGVKDANNWSASAIQAEIPFPGAPTYVQSEDCLYLNVFAPTWEAPSAAGFPVMFFIHGGGYVMGNAEHTGVDGIARLLVSKDVIVVSIQYRLGYLGFWATEDGSIPANLGLWDQTQALKWVQENIAAFGGDKSNVTIFGISAGGASTDLLTLSPHSNRLFNRIIGLCGSAYCSWGMNSKEKQLQFCAEKIKEFQLQDKSPAELHDALMAIDAKEYGKAPLMDIMVGFHGAPVVDGDFFPESLEELRKKAPAIPVITGVSTSEAAMFGIMQPPTRNVDDVKEVLETTTNSKDIAAAREAVTNFYKIDEATKGCQGKIQFLSDALFDSSALRMSHEVLELKKDAAPVYLYLFEYYNPSTFDLLPFKVEMKSSTHGAEMTSTFGKGFFDAVKLSDDDWKMAAIWSRLLVNFATYGDPNGTATAPESKLPFEWPRVTEEHKERHLNVALTPSVRDSLLDGRPAKLLQILKEHRVKN